MSVYTHIDDSIARYIDTLCDAARKDDPYIGPNCVRVRVRVRMWLRDHGPQNKYVSLSREHVRVRCTASEFPLSTPEYPPQQHESHLRPPRYPFSTPLSTH